MHKKKQYATEDISDDTTTNKKALSQKRLPLETIKGKKCITKCHDAGQSYLHPITLDDIGPRYTKNTNTCAVYPFYDENVSNLLEFGVCDTNDNSTKYYLTEKEALMFRPYFDPKSFLHSIYNLLTFNQVIMWTLDNANDNFRTVKRVHNAAWKAYGSNIENISDVVIDFYYELAKNNWLKDYVKNIKNKYSFDIFSEIPNGSKLSISDIVIQKFFDKNFFTQVIINYIDTFAPEWTSIKSHYGNLKRFVYKKLVENIKMKHSE